MLSTLRRGVFAISENTEGLERKALDQVPVYEIHGNMNTMRCHGECTSGTFPTRTLTNEMETIPICPVCGNLARPNIQLNDEDYDAGRYQGESAFFAAEEADCLIILGSTLNKSLSAGIVKSAARRGALIIEIGSYCQLEYGNVLKINQNSTEVFPMLVDITEQVLCTN